MSSAHAFAEPLHHPIGSEIVEFHPLTNKQFYSLGPWAKGRLKAEGREQFSKVEDFIKWCSHVEGLSEFSEEVNQRLYSPEGFIRTLWLSASSARPDLTEEQVAEWFYVEPLALMQIAAKLLNPPDPEDANDGDSPPSRAQAD
ncbi:MAG: hypothetical protein IT209_00755 [Armatimonadetes bacterium]|nr:hypothetical protein [Armatimonadota bacterium]